MREDRDTVASPVSDTNLQAPVGIDRNGMARAASQAFVLPVRYRVDGQGIQTVLPGASLVP